MRGEVHISICYPKATKTSQQISSLDSVSSTLSSWFQIIALIHYSVIILSVKNLNKAILKMLGKVF